MPRKKKTEPEQPNIFGDADAVFNALETEVTIVNEELADQRKKITRAETVIEILEERKAKLVKARDIVKKSKQEEVKKGDEV